MGGLGGVNSGAAVSIERLASDQVGDEPVRVRAGCRDLDPVGAQSGEEDRPECLAEHPDLDVERIDARTVRVGWRAVDALHDVADEAGDVGQLVEVDPIQRVLRRVVVTSLPATEEQERLPGFGEGRVVGDRADVIVSSKLPPWNGTRPMRGISLSR